MRQSFACSTLSLALQWQRMVSYIDGKPVLPAQPACSMHGSTTTRGRPGTSAFVPALSYMCSAFHYIATWLLMQMNKINRFLVSILSYMNQQLYSYTITCSLLAQVIYISKIKSNWPCISALPMALLSLFFRVGQAEYLLGKLGYWLSYGPAGIRSRMFHFSTLDIIQYCRRETRRMLRRVTALCAGVLPLEKSTDFSWLARVVVLRICAAKCKYTKTKHGANLSHKFPHITKSWSPIQRMTPQWNTLWAENHLGQGIYISEQARRPGGGRERLEGGQNSIPRP